VPLVDSSTISHFSPR